MILENLIAHTVGYFYFQPKDSSAENQVPLQPLRYFWGVVFSTLILIGLNQNQLNYSLITINAGLILFNVIYQRFIKQAIIFFLKHNIASNKAHPLQSVFKANQDVVTFLIHQMLYLLWLFASYRLITEAISVPISILLSIILIILAALLWSQDEKMKPQLIPFKEKGLVEATTYIVIGSVCLFISQLIIRSIEIFQSTPSLYMQLSTHSSYRLFLSFLFVLLLLMKPTNILIRSMSSTYDPKELKKLSLDEQILSEKHHEREAGFKGAGALIGNLERLLILLSFIFGSLLSIVAVLSIKAFARYKMIAENPYFSEYFVIGTMLSVLMTLASYGLLLLLLA